MEVEDHVLEGIGEKRLFMWVTKAEGEQIMEINTETGLCSSFLKKQGLL